MAENMKVWKISTNSEPPFFIHRVLTDRQCWKTQILGKWVTEG